MKLQIFPDLYLLILSLFILTSPFCFILELKCQFLVPLFNIFFSSRSVSSKCRLFHQPLSIIRFRFSQKSPFFLAFQLAFSQKFPFSQLFIFSITTTPLKSFLARVAEALNVIFFISLCQLLGLKVICIIFPKIPDFLTLLSFQSP